MKLVLVILSFLTLGAASSAKADALNDLGRLIAANPTARIELDTKSTKDPVSISVSLDGETLATEEARPEDFVAAVRENVAAYTLSSSAFNYVVNWQSLSYEWNGKSVAVYDLLSDIKDHQSDPNVQDPTAQEGYLNENYTILSVVGPYVSFRSNGEEYYPGAAHPNSWNSFTAVDVRKLGLGYADGGKANLLDLVDEDSLVAALKADKALIRLTKRKGALKKLKSAATIHQVGAAVSDALLGDCLAFPGFENKISSFAIYSYDAKTNLVSVRIPLETAAHACEASAPFLQLGLRVKPLSEFQALLSAQEADKDGLFMKDLKK